MEVWMFSEAFPLVLLPGHNFQFIGAGSKAWISVGFAHNRDVMWLFKLYYHSPDELWHFASCFLSLLGPGTSTGDDGRGEIVYIDRGSKTVMAHARAPGAAPPLGAGGRDGSRRFL
jgi:hypothetical protein